MPPEGRLGRYKVVERHDDGLCLLAPESVDEVIAETAERPLNGDEFLDALARLGRRRLSAASAVSPYLRAASRASPASSHGCRASSGVRFKAAVEKLVEALRGGGEPPNSLRVKRVQGTKDVWEMSYSGDGRATFRYGTEVKPGETHVEWLRVGGHETLSRPQ